MVDRGRKVRAVLQVALGIAVVLGALIGSQVLLLLAVIALVAVILWEVDLRRRPRL